MSEVGNQIHTPLVNRSFHDGLSHTAGHDGIGGATIDAEISYDVEGLEGDGYVALDAQADNMEARFEELLAYVDPNRPEETLSELAHMLFTTPQELMDLARATKSGDFSKFSSKNEFLGAAALMKSLQNHPALAEAAIQDNEVVGLALAKVLLQQDAKQSAGVASRSAVQTITVSIADPNEARERFSDDLREGKLTQQQLVDIFLGEDPYGFDMPLKDLQHHILSHAVRTDETLARFLVMELISQEKNVPMPPAKLPTEFGTVVQWSMNYDDYVDKMLEWLEGANNSLPRGDEKLANFLRAFPVVFVATSAGNHEGMLPFLTALEKNRHTKVSLDFSLPKAHIPMSAAALAKFLRDESTITGITDIDGMTPHDLLLFVQSLRMKFQQRLVREQAVDMRANLEKAEALAALKGLIADLRTSKSDSIDASVVDELREHGIEALPSDGDKFTAIEGMDDEGNEIIVKYKLENMEDDDIKEHWQRVVDDVDSKVQSTNSSQQLQMINMQKTNSIYNESVDFISNVLAKLLRLNEQIVSKMGN